VKGAALFVTKTWNIARFISSFPTVTEDYELVALDKMMLAQLNKLVRDCKSGYEELDFHGPANAVRVFTWNMFADHYVEAVKSRAYNQHGEFDVKLQRGAWYTLHTCLDTIIKLLAPICPFVTEALWRELYSGKSVHLQVMPQEKREFESDLAGLLPQLMDFNAAVWRYKKEKSVALSQEVKATIYAPRELEVFEADLKAMHRIKQLVFGQPSKEVEARAKALGIMFVVE